MHTLGCAPSGEFHKLSYLAGQHWFSHYLIWCWRKSFDPMGSMFGDAYHKLTLVHLCWGRSLKIGSQLVICLTGCNQGDWGYKISLLSIMPLSQLTITAGAYLIALNPCLTISVDKSEIKLDSCTLFNTNGFPVSLGHWRPLHIQALTNLLKFCPTFCCKN